jgi:ABC-2 type transport system ATP-binding protein
MFTGLRKMGIPPMLALAIVIVILLAALAYILHNILSSGGTHSLSLLFLVAIVFVLVRMLLRARDIMTVKPTEQATQTIQTSQSAQATIHDQSVGTVSSREAMAHVPAIELQAVSKSYGSVLALDEVSFTIPQGQVVALLGPNGAGKTTAINLMLGLRRPTRGQARLLGRDPRDRRARSCCGVMLQESGVPLTLTVRETVALFRSYYPTPMSLTRILEMAELSGKASARVGALSGGQRQRLYFALAVCGDPDVLFLDEPTSGLDVEARHNFWEQMREFVRMGKTILLTTHYLEEADALADRILVIDSGRVYADDSPAALKARVASKRVSFDVSEPLQAGVFAGLPVQQLELGAHHITLLTPQLETVLRALFAQPVEIANLEVAGAGLEEAFLQLIQRPEQQKGA